MPEDNQFYLTVFENNWEAARKIEQAVMPGLDNYVINNSGTKEDAREIYVRAVGIAWLQYREKKLTLHSLYKPLPNYIFGIARNLWLRALEKRKKRFTNLEDEGYIGDTDIEAAIVSQEIRQLFLEKIQKLSDTCRDLLEFKLDGLKAEEVATKLGYANAGVVRSRLCTCKKKLIELIKHDPRYKELTDK